MNSTQEQTTRKDEADRQKAIEHLREMICDIPVSMLTTIASDGTLHSRPMVNINDRFEGELWFFTHRDDPKVAEIASNSQVNVSFASPQKHRFVSTSGQAEMVDDRKQLELHWSDACEPWFPKGLEDENLALLKVDVSSAEYWDQQMGSMVAIAGLFKRLATGNKQQTMNTGKMEWSSESQS